MVIFFLSSATAFFMGNRLFCEHFQSIIVSMTMILTKPDRFQFFMAIIIVDILWLQFIGNAVFWRWAKLLLNPKFRLRYLEILLLYMPFNHWILFSFSCIVMTEELKKKRRRKKLNVYLFETLNNTPVHVKRKPHRFYLWTKSRSNK